MDNDDILLKDIMRAFKDKQYFQQVYAQSVNDAQRKNFIEGEFAMWIFREMQEESKRKHIPYEPIRKEGWIVDFTSSLLH